MRIVNDIPNGEGCKKTVTKFVRYGGEAPPLAADEIFRSLTLLSLTLGKLFQGTYCILYQKEGKNNVCFGH